jgi:hypothetical protein
LLGGEGLAATQLNECASLLSRLPASGSVSTRRCALDGIATIVKLGDGGKQGGVDFR